MRDYKKYEVWKQAHQVALDIYNSTKSFPKEETYVITSQLRRASLSVPTNIVEGASRKTAKEFAHFLNISSGSAAETEYLILFSKELGYITEEKSNELIERVVSVRKMLNSLQTKVRK